MQFYSTQGYQNQARYKLNMISKILYEETGFHMKYKNIFFFAVTLMFVFFFPIYFSMYLYCTDRSSKRTLPCLTQTLQIPLAVVKHGIA